MKNNYDNTMIKKYEEFINELRFNKIDDNGNERNIEDRKENNLPTVKTRFGKLKVENPGANFDMAIELLVNTRTYGFMQFMMPGYFGKYLKDKTYYVVGMKQKFEVNFKSCSGFNDWLLVDEHDRITENDYTSLKKLIINTFERLEIDFFIDDKCIGTSPTDLTNHICISVSDEDLNGRDYVLKVLLDELNDKLDKSIELFTDKGKHKIGVPLHIDNIERLEQIKKIVKDEL